MADDWRPGDLALCVSDIFEEAEGPETWFPLPGHVYSVAGTVADCGDGFGPALLLKEEPAHVPNPGLGWPAKFFLKATPPEADEFDREVISLMTSNPVKEPAQ